MRKLTSAITLALLVLGSTSPLAAKKHHNDNNINHNNHNDRNDYVDCRIDKKDDGKDGAIIGGASAGTVAAVAGAGVVGTVAVGAAGAVVGKAIGKSGKDC